MRNQSGLNSQPLNNHSIQLLKQLLGCCLILCIFSSTSAIAATPLEDKALLLFKQKLWDKAKSQGIQRATFVRAINKTTPNYKLPRVRTTANWARLSRLSKQHKGKPVSKRPLPASCYRPRQKEFLFPTLYFPKKHISSLVKRGRAIRQKYKATFAKIEKKYGVDMRAVMGIWGRETAFGAAKNRFDGIRTLLSLAFAGPKAKRPQHLQNLLYALKFIDDGHISLKKFKTTFAGATGYPQFTPDVFATYAVDFDGDGRKNIWSNVPDAMASAANYLKGIGWQSGQGWGYEVVVPKGFNCAAEGPNGRRTITEWKKLGVRRQISSMGKSQKFPDQNQKVQLVSPAGTNGPIFLVTENFEVFRRYNKADLYALFVGHLGDKIWCQKTAQKVSETCEFVRPWPSKDHFNFTRKRICEMQIYLKRSGASDETPDGLFGGKTRNGIGSYEQQIGRLPSCYPNNKLLQTLRKAYSKS